MADSILEMLLPLSIFLLHWQLCYPSLASPLPTLLALDLLFLCVGFQIRNKGAWSQSLPLGCKHMSVGEVWTPMSSLWEEVFL